MGRVWGASGFLGSLSPPRTSLFCDLPSVRRPPGTQSRPFVDCHLDHSLHLEWAHGRDPNTNSVTIPRRGKSHFSALSEARGVGVRGSCYMIHLCVCPQRISSFSPLILPTKSRNVGVPDASHNKSPSGKVCRGMNRFYYPPTSCTSPLHTFNPRVRDLHPVFSSLG